MATSHAKNEEGTDDGADVKKQVVVGGAVNNSIQTNLDAEKTVVRKLDWRIISLLFVLCPFFISSATIQQS